MKAKDVQALKRYWAKVDGRRVPVVVDVIERTGFGKSLRRKYHVTNTVMGLHAVLRTSAAFIESR